eukprot:gene13006-13108_t
MFRLPRRSAPKTPERDDINTSTLRPGKAGNQQCRRLSYLIFTYPNLAPQCPPRQPVSSEFSDQQWVRAASTRRVKFSWQSYILILRLIPIFHRFASLLNCRHPKEIVMKSDLPCIIVLAGGAGRRIGGGKPDVLLAGHPLIDHIVRRLTPQGQVVISGDSQLAARLSLPFIADEGAHGGPLSGVLASLRWARARDVGDIVTVPCDAPFTPADLVSRLGKTTATPAIARSGSRLHPTFGRWAITLIPALTEFYQNQGQRKMLDFIRQMPFEAVDWPVKPFDPLFNINTPFDLALAEIIASTGIAPKHLDATI